MTERTEDMLTALRALEDERDYAIGRGNRASFERDEARAIAAELREQLSAYFLAGTPVDPFPWEEL